MNPVRTLCVVIALGLLFNGYVAWREYGLYTGLQAALEHQAGVMKKDIWELDLTALETQCDRFVKEYQVTGVELIHPDGSVFLKVLSDAKPTLAGRLKGCLGLVQPISLSTPVIANDQHLFAVVRLHKQSALPFHYCWVGLCLIALGSLAASSLKQRCKPEPAEVA